MAAGIDLESGTAMATAFDKRGIEFKQHPDTGVTFGGLLLRNGGKYLISRNKYRVHFPITPCWAWTSRSPRLVRSS